MKRYRILEKIYGEGTKDQMSLFFPQYMDSNTLDQNISITWYNIISTSTDGEGIVTCTTKEAAIEFVQKKKQEDIPPIERIHTID